MSVHSREVRLGVVMFGGVSLAVYINGVSQELFRAVRGRGIYRLLKALTDSHVVVDVLSGASAGGINGVLLSTALCNGTEFGVSAELWRSLADIRALLSLDDDLVPLSSTPPLDSVLDGKYHHAQMAGAIEQLINTPCSKRNNEDPSPLEELDLFVTATDIEGQKGSWIDAQGNRIQLEDHRALFWLKHRKDRNQPFSACAASDGSLSQDGSVQKANIDALASVAHITSCFPGAFRPVDVTIPVRSRAGEGEKFADEESAVHARLVRWGNLRPAGDGKPRRALYMDGGVLENKPFTSTIDAIFSRLAGRPVTRYMLYIDPAPADESRVKPKPRSDPEHARRLLPVALAAASGLPRFESIDGDLARVELHNQQVRRYEAIVRAATAAALANPNPSTGDTPSARAYLRARVGGLASAVVEAASPTPPTPSSAIPGQRPGISELSELIERNCDWGIFSAVFAHLDVLFGFRRLVHLTYLVDDSAQVTLENRARVGMSLPLQGGASAFHIEQRLLDAINGQIEMYEVLRARLETALRAFIAQSPPKWGDTGYWRWLGGRLDAVMKRLPHPECFAGQATGIAAGTITEPELKLLRGSRSAPFDANEREVAGPPFLFAAQEYERRLLVSEPKLLQVYDRFLQIDEVAYPLELVSELRGRDQIRTVRISPLDSTRGYAAGFEKKLCGEQLGAFGAFFDESWRCNDLMWGRLDGVSQLIDLLLDAKRIENLDSALIETALKETLGPELDLSSVFPNSPLPDRKELESWLHELCARNPDRAQTARRKLAAGSPLRDLLLRAAQLEILAEELPGVLESTGAQRLAAAQEGSLLARLGALPEATQAAVASVASKYFRPEFYQISGQTLPKALPSARLHAFEKRAFANLKQALVPSLPSWFFADTLFGHALRKAAEGGLDAAFWVFTVLWHNGKLGPDESSPGLPREAAETKAGRRRELEGEVGRDAAREQ